MALKTRAVSTPTVSEPADRENDRAQPVLLLETVGAVEQVTPILLDQATTHLCVSRSTNSHAGRVVIHRSSLGWNLRSHEADCRLNGVPVEDVWLYEGDRITISGTEFRVRPATTEELLGQLPRANAAALDEQQARTAERTIAVASRERDLAEWEQCLADCEADLRIRKLRTGRDESSVGDNSADVADRSFLAELQELRTNPAALDADQQRLQSWLATLQQERTVLEQERGRLAADRALLADRAPLVTTDAAPCSLPATIAAAVATPGPPQPTTFENRKSSSADLSSESETAPIGREWHVPRRSLLESRLRMNSLRAVANHSARRALTHHFWKRHRSAVVLKVALVAMSFALACVLYWHHGAMESSISGLIWGAAAIGLITLSGLVHTWTEVNRLNARFRVPATNGGLELAEVNASDLLPGT